LIHVSNCFSSGVFDGDEDVAVVVVEKEKEENREME
jgi:hypothetical protein